MTAEPTILVAAYGAWAKAENNPATLTLRAVAGRDWPGINLVPLEVPVLTDRLTDTIEAALAEHKPDVWVGIGLAPGSTTMRAEMLGTNWRDFDVPDASGNRLEGVPVIEGAPTAYAATIPNRRIVKAIRAAGIPAIISYAAGNHLCNQMLFTVSHLVAERGLAMTCGFLHVPFTPEHVAKHCDPHDPEPSMALPMMADAVSIAIGEIIADWGAA